MVYNWVIQLLIAVAVAVVSYIITPKPKGPQSAATKDLENPVAEAGKPVPKIWGTMTVKGVNVLWFGDKSVREYEIKT
jgi:hypothetical protein